MGLVRSAAQRQQSLPRVLNSLGFTLGCVTICLTAGASPLAAAGCLIWGTIWHFVGARAFEPPAPPPETPQFIPSPPADVHAESDPALAALQEMSDLPQQLESTDLLQACANLEARVIQVLQQVSMSAEQVETGSSGTLHAMSITTERTQTAQVQTEAITETMGQMADAAERMRSAVATIDEQATTTAQIASGALEATQDAEGQTRALSQSAEHIGTIVDLINAVARQTRLLALNATIEAERAGEAGRGFAVVAEQVRALAQKTSEANAEVGQQISDIQHQVGVVISVIQRISDQVGRFHEIAHTIGRSVSAQADSTGQIASLATHNRDRIASISQDLADMANAVLNTGGHANESLKASAMFRTTGQDLTHVVLDFLKELREGAFGNRRATPRYDVSPPRPITVKGMAGEGSLLNISLTGALLHLPQAVGLGQQLTLQVRGLSDYEVEVMRVMGDRVGVRFLLSISRRPDVAEMVADIARQIAPQSERPHVSEPSPPEEDAGDMELWI